MMYLSSIDEVLSYMGKNNVQKKMVHATKSQRYAAEFMDIFINMVIVIAIVYYSSSFKIIAIILIVILFFIQFLLFIKGRSIGKLLLGLKIVTLAGSKADFLTLYSRSYRKSRMYLLSIYEGNFNHDEHTLTTVIDLRKSENLDFTEHQEIIEDDWSLS
jgi:hypothetical protein